jgi:hypothetical protein
MFILGNVTISLESYGMSEQTQFMVKIADNTPNWVYYVTGAAAIASIVAPIVAFFHRRK